MSILIQQVHCPNCGAPLTDLQSTFARCAFCETEFRIPAMPGYQIPAPRPYPHPPGLTTVQVGNQAYRVHGRLAGGHHSQVLLARRESALTELVLLKIAHPGAEKALDREWRALQQLRGRDDYLSRLLPPPVSFAQIRWNGHPPRVAAVYRWRSGFLYTLSDVRRQYPQGVDPGAAVWMWNRILDQLRALEQLGYRHGDLQPEHVLIHPRDHGVALCGWSLAEPSNASDLAAGGRCIGGLLGRSAPCPLQELTRGAGAFSSAAALKEELRQVARAAFGPPRFHPFIMK